ncbi:MAG TPA: DMT family transporter [Deltaproteobacteria bacterium]|nr:DMT family transporter [Deltaproteobacteria bacterium]
MPLVPTLALLTAMVLWASSFIALKLAFSAFDPMVVIFFRMAIGSLCFVLLPSVFSGNTVARGDLKYLGFMVLCEPCLYFLFEAKALVNTTASQAGMITAMLPLLVALSAHLYLKETVTRRTIVGFFIAISGAVMLSLGAEASPDAPNPLLGNLFEFLAMVCATGYTVVLKQLTARYKPLFLTAVQAFAGSIFYLPFVFFAPEVFPPGAGCLPVASIVYLGVFVTLGAYGLYNFGVSRIPASQASAFVNLIPVFTVILGWIILNERFTPVQYLASALVFFGVFLSQDRSVVLQVEMAMEEERPS